MANQDAAGIPNKARGTGAAGSAKEMAASAAQTVKQEAASFAATAQEKARDQIQEHKAAASNTLGDFANAVRRAGDELAQHDQSMAGRIVKQAADSLEGLSRSVSERRPEDLLQAVRDFGRANPVAFIGGSVLVGLALGRFLRSSEQHRSQMQGQGYVPLEEFADRAGSTAPGGSGRFSDLEGPGPIDEGGLADVPRPGDGSPIGDRPTGYQEGLPGSRTTPEI